MANILLYMAPARGSLYPMVPVLQSLADKGHEVCAIVPECEIAMLARQGISARPQDYAVECCAMSDHTKDNHAEALQVALQERVRRGRLEADDLAFWAGKLSPDLLLLDANSFGAVAWAEGAGLPWASWATRLLPFPASNIPPFSLGLPLKQGTFSALKNLGKKNTIQRVYDTALSNLNDLRASQGAMPLDSVISWPANLSTLLYFTAEPFEYAREWGSNVYLVGPSTWEPPYDAPVELDSDREVILVSCCCDFLNEIKMVQVALSAIDLAKYQVVVTTCAVDPKHIEAPPGVKVMRFASHNEIMSRAAAVICPGNLGTVQKAMCHGVPVLTIAHARDQIEVGQRLKHLGVGSSLHITQLDASSLRHELKQTLGCRGQAQVFGQEFSAHNSASRASTIVQNLLEHS